MPGSSLSDPSFPKEDATPSPVPASTTEQKPTLSAPPWRQLFTERDLALISSMPSPHWQMVEMRDCGSRTPLAPCIEPPCSDAPIVFEGLGQSIAECHHAADLTETYGYKGEKEQRLDQIDTRKFGVLHRKQSREIKQPQHNGHDWDGYKWDCGREQCGSVFQADLLPGYDHEARQAIKAFRHKMHDRGYSWPQIDDIAKARSFGTEHPADFDSRRTRPSSGRGWTFASKFVRNGVVPEPVVEPLSVSLQRMRTAISETPVKITTAIGERLPPQIPFLPNTTSPQMLYAPALHSHVTAEATVLSQIPNGQLRPKHLHVESPARFAPQLRIKEKAAKPQPPELVLPRLQTLFESLQALEPGLPLVIEREKVIDIIGEAHFCHKSGGRKVLPGSGQSGRSTVLLVYSYSG